MIFSKTGICTIEFLQASMQFLHSKKNKDLGVTLRGKPLRVGRYALRYRSFLRSLCSLRNAYGGAPCPNARLIKIVTRISTIRYAKSAYSELIALVSLFQFVIYFLDHIKVCAQCFSNHKIPFLSLERYYIAKENACHFHSYFSSILIPP